MKKIGIFGGSFDLAHIGHLAVSLFCLEQLKLDNVKWVINQNPLKIQSRYRIEKRLKVANYITNFDKRISAAMSSEISAFNIIKDIIDSEKNCSYFWIMGLDSYLTLDMWKDYLQIVNTIPMIVFNRSIDKYAISNDIMSKLFIEQEIRYEGNDIIFTKCQLLKLVFEFAQKYGQKVCLNQELIFKMSSPTVYFVPKILCNLSSTKILEIT